MGHHRLWKITLQHSTNFRLSIEQLHHKAATYDGNNSQHQSFDVSKAFALQKENHKNIEGRDTNTDR